MDPIADNDGTSRFNDLQKILSAAERNRKFDDWTKDLRSAESPMDEFEGSSAASEYSASELSVDLPVSFDLPFHARVGNRLKTLFSEGTLRRLRARRGDLYLLIAVILLAVALRSSIGPIGFSKVRALWHQEMIDAGLVDPPSTKAAQPEARVWVDFSTNVYYCPGSRKYGKTRNGQFTTEGNARLSQYEPAFHKACP
ncbi:MAG TPA: hypothetical protein VJQ82_03315 [Terriglobales bacterium]|nr:hypothetical protein [Terriglobales bacterium]